MKHNKRRTTDTLNSDSDNSINSSSDSRSNDNSSSSSSDVDTDSDKENTNNNNKRRNTRRNCKSKYASKTTNKTKTKEKKRHKQNKHISYNNTSKNNIQTRNNRRTRRKRNNTIKKKKTNHTSKYNRKRKRFFELEEETSYISNANETISEEYSLSDFQSVAIPECPKCGQVLLATAHITTTGKHKDTIPPSATYPGHKKGDKWVESVTCEINECGRLISVPKLLLDYEKKQGYGMSCKDCDFDMCMECYSILENNGNKDGAPPKKKRRRNRNRKRQT